MFKRLLIALALPALLAACATHVHAPYPTWTAYKAAYPNARFIVVRERPATNRTCWKVRRGWRCVVR